MASKDMTAVPVHGAWADGSSWAKVIAALAASGVKTIAAPLPLTSFQEDVAALDRTLERADGPVVLVGHAYAGGRDARASSIRVRQAPLAGGEFEGLATLGRSDASATTRRRTLRVPGVKVFALTC